MDAVAPGSLEATGLESEASGCGKGELVSPLGKRVSPHNVASQSETERARTDCSDDWMAWENCGMGLAMAFDQPGRPIRTAADHCPIQTLHESSTKPGVAAFFGTDGRSASPTRVEAPLHPATAGRTARLKW